MRLIPPLAAAAACLALAAPALAQSPASAPGAGSTDRAPRHPASAGPTLTDLDAKNDPFLWLEDIEAPRSLEWVEGQNKRTAQRLESDPRYETFHKQALAIFTADTRIPEPSFLGKGLSNLWQDAAHPKGLWRRTTLESYRSAAPQWETLIDLDALSKAEGKDWIFKGASCLPPEERLCIVRLSIGGADAVEMREFDTQRKAFVPGGFFIPMGKNGASWLDRDTLIVDADFSGKGADLSRAGYPLEVRTQKRAHPFGSGEVLYRAEAGDNRADARPLLGPDRAVKAVVIDRGVSFFESEHFLATAQGPVRLPFPRKAQIDGLVGDQLVVTLREDFAGFPGGAIVSYDLEALKRDPAAAKPTLVFSPGPTQAVEGSRGVRDRLLVSILDNVRGQVLVFAHGAGGWTSSPLPMPAAATISLRSADDDTDRIFIQTEGFLTPPTLWLADAAAVTKVEMKRAPALFDGSKDVVEQSFATSADGTRIPYFIVHPKGMKLDGENPVQMFGYGGFQLSETPAYKPEMGKLWLERGGVYVMANLRGGGEFGPKWHEAALREHRQRAFDDFAAVARDLMAKKITLPRHMGIYARSNGGILTTVSMTQHPELFGAVVVESPLIDMLRYQKLSAGASWMAEYGDPDNAADRAFISKYSAYQVLHAGMKLPEPYVTTNTRDDRVHPGHPRKFVAKMESLGYPVLYYENTFGGHANDADPELNARRWARHYVYLSQKLMDDPAK